MNEEDALYFLHKQGYTVFTIPQLTWIEINALCNAQQRKNRKEAQNAKINKNHGKFR
jgi:hypothetical protein